MEETLAYLVCYGAAGILGWFLPLTPHSYRRGDRALVRSDRGLEAGTILRADPPPPFILDMGQLVRPLASADEVRFACLKSRAEEGFAFAHRLCNELALPVEVVDVEVVPEPLIFVVHYLHFGDADLRPLVSALSKHLDAFVQVHDLTSPTPTAGGCGSCGEGGGCGSGGCGSGGCGSEGGCGSGCGTGDHATFERDWKAFFAERRQQVEAFRVARVTA